MPPPLGNLPPEQAEAALEAPPALPTPAKEGDAMPSAAGPAALGAEAPQLGEEELEGLLEEDEENKAGTAKVRSTQQLAADPGAAAAGEGGAQGQEQGPVAAAAGAVATAASAAASKAGEAASATVEKAGEALGAAKDKTVEVMASAAEGAKESVRQVGIVFNTHY